MIQSTKPSLRDSTARFKFLNASETAKKYARLKGIQKDLSGHVTDRHRVE